MQCCTEHYAESVRSNTHQYPPAAQRVSWGVSGLCRQATEAHEGAWKDSKQRTSIRHYQVGFGVACEGLLGSEACFFPHYMWGFAAVQLRCCACRSPR
jgi:hypothetical protein